MGSGTQFAPSPVPSPATGGVSPEYARTCKSHTFQVPLFEPGEYPVRSQEAHFVLGGVIVGMVATWLLFVMQVGPFRKLAIAYTVSGCLCVSVGVYLLLWVFVFLKPGHLEELWEYSTTDLLQMQHVAISLLAICCGAIEISGGLGWISHSQWHVLWGVDMAALGLVFLVHPQPDYAGASSHTVLGLVIVFGAMFLMSEKSKNFPEDLNESWNIIIAGGLFLFGSSILMRYEEAAVKQHHGYYTSCHNGWPVTMIAHLLAIFSACMLCACILLPGWLIACMAESFDQLVERPAEACANCCSCACCRGGAPATGTAAGHATRAYRGEPAHRGRRGRRQLHQGRYAPVHTMESDADASDSENLELTGVPRH